MATEVYAYLFVEGDSVPFDELTAALGAPPDQVERKSELSHSGARNPRKKDCWKLMTPRRADYDLGEDVVRFLARIEGREAALRELAKRYGLCVGVNCVGYIDTEDSTPALSFDAELLGKLSSIGAALDIDLYANRRA